MNAIETYFLDGVMPQFWLALVISMPLGIAP